MNRFLDFLSHSVAACTALVLVVFTLIGLACMAYGPIVIVGCSMVLFAFFAGAFLQHVLSDWRN